MYILTGETSSSHLTPEESNLLMLFRSNPPVLQAAAMRVLVGTTEKVSAGILIQGDASGQMNTGPVTNDATTMNFGSKRG